MNLFCQNQFVHGHEGFAHRYSRLQVAGVDVATPADIATGLAKATESATGDKDKVKVLMQVKTGDQTRFVALSQKKE